MLPKPASKPMISNWDVRITPSCYRALLLEQPEIERAIATAEDEDSDDRSGHTATSPLDASDSELSWTSTSRSCPSSPRTASSSPPARPTSTPPSSPGPPPPRPSPSRPTSSPSPSPPPALHPRLSPLPPRLSLTGTLIFSHRTYDLATALALHAGIRDDAYAYDEPDPDPDSESSPSHPYDS
ncbi:hypothetical protein B0H14DRAFT_3436525 [Mycena olivaceomarginata]|nr:hypothetical protein B0H14DRAFT_3436525 [Mycena olivaceomarginata]